MTFEDEHIHNTSIILLEFPCLRKLLIYNQFNLKYLNQRKIFTNHFGWDQFK